MFDNKEAFIEFMKTDEWKSVCQPVFDSKVSLGIKSYVEKHPDSQALGPRLDEIETKIVEKDNELKKKDLEFFAFRKCVDNEIDYELLNGYPLEDEKAIEDKIIQLSKSISTAKVKNLNDFIASNSVKPQSGIVTEKGFHDYVLEAEERDRHG